MEEFTDAQNALISEQGADGHPIAEICRKAGMSETTYFNWNKKYDKPVQNAYGNFDIYFGPKSPGEGKNWLATIPGKGFLAIFRLYGPKKAFFDKSWKPDDIVKLQ